MKHHDSHHRPVILAMLVMPGWKLLHQRRRVLQLQRRSIHQKDGPLQSAPSFLHLLAQLFHDTLIHLSSH